MNGTVSSFRALGTTCSVISLDEAATDAALRAVQEVVRNIDDTCSRFRNDSELARVNARAGRWTAMSPLFTQALQTALRAAQITDGIIDPTVGTVMKAIGYDADFDSIDRDGHMVVRMARLPGWKSIRVDASNDCIRLHPGTSLDFGATAKALAADMAAAWATETTGGGVLVNLGGDIATAGDAPRGGWSIGLADWHGTSPEDTDETICITAGAVATSSTSVRHWTRNGDTMHHIVDPATAQPARSPWRTVSVVADTCVDANIASTAAIVLGDRAPDWLGAHELDARLVHHNGDVLRLGRWPSEEAR